MNRPPKHYDGDQALVNAQIETNRAVFAFNLRDNAGKTHGARTDPQYILERIDKAIDDLNHARVHYQRKASALKQQQLALG